MTAWSVALVVPLHVEGEWKLQEMDVKYLAAKSLHVGAYAFLTVLSGWLPVSSRKRWLFILFFAFHAVITEMIQREVPGRTGELDDVALDLFGVSIGCVLSWKWWVSE